ncbi:hypothetical protein E3N88_40997 [Mikania micrantha]|uniref:BRX domain-containing protein n=1 Tax=Mikania micrantha TaxID=192012 RepID=A0A5N6LP56_9ASTR|nr:hypothetical protein E3N88_40997 [Mikania micrantha]
MQGRFAGVRSSNHIPTNGDYADTDSEAGSESDRLHFRRKLFTEKQAEIWWCENRGRILEYYNLQPSNHQSIPPRSEDKKNLPSICSGGGKCPICNGLEKKAGICLCCPDWEEETGLSTTQTLSLDPANLEETEWIEKDEPGVFITIKALPCGNRELIQIGTLDQKFLRSFESLSRARFGEVNARMWWEQNRARVKEQYL